MVFTFEPKIVKYLLLLVLFASLLKAEAQPGDSIKYRKRTSYLTDNPKLSGQDLLVDSIVRSYMQSPENSRLSIGISKNGKDYFYNYGETQREPKVLPDQNTIYEIGPLTSTFCGLLLAKAVQENKIRLDDDIRKYLPGNYPNLLYNKTPLLIKHLANHSSGLRNVPLDLPDREGYQPLNPYKHYNKEMILNYLKTVKLDVEPGTVCDYSNLGVALLGIILEKIYNEDFEALVKEKICIPAGMTSTTVRMSTEQLTHFFQGYNQEGSITSPWDLGGFVAAGGLKSTTGDMLKYLRYHSGEKDEATKLTHQLSFNGRQKVGLCWSVKKTKQGNTLLWQNGGTYGFTGFSGFIKEKEYAVIILANSATQVDYIAIAILKYLQQ